MSSQSLETADGSSTAQSTTVRIRSVLEARGRDGSLAMLAGGATLASALTAGRKTQSRATTAVLAMAGAGLVGFGARQRQVVRGKDAVETGADARRDEAGEKRVSDDAHIEAAGDLGAQRNADESASVYQSETEPNPRGMSDRSDVETDDQGDENSDIRFVEGEQGAPHRETHLEDETAHDPRLHPHNDDEPTEIDLSEAAMADEASEAAGPHPEQAYPALEGTDPEPTSDKAPERTGEGAVAPADSSSDEGDDDNERSDESDDGFESRSDEDERGTSNDE